MGQQQLLLLILSAIIVGIAIVLGINMFSENAVQANQDAVMQDMLTIASRAQGWFRRPTQLGGGGRNFSLISLAVINFGDTTNGTYAITAPNPTQFTLTGVGREDGDDDGTNMTITFNVLADSVSPTIFTSR